VLLAGSRPHSLYVRETWHATCYTCLLLLQTVPPLLLLLRVVLLLAGAAKGYAQACKCSWKLLELGKGTAGLLLLYRRLLCSCKLLLLLLLLVPHGALLSLLLWFQAYTVKDSLHGVGRIECHHLVGRPQLAASNSSSTHATICSRCLRPCSSACCSVNSSHSSTALLLLLLHCPAYRVLPI
jgi:hypothetical protein